MPSTVPFQNLNLRGPGQRWILAGHFPNPAQNVDRVNEQGDRPGEAGPSLMPARNILESCGLRAQHAQEEPVAKEVKTRTQTRGAAWGLGDCCRMSWMFFSFIQEGIEGREAWGTKTAVAVRKTFLPNKAQECVPGRWSPLCDQAGSGVWEGPLRHLYVLKLSALES